MTGEPKKRILFLSFDGLTDTLGASQIIPYLNGLADYFEITIVSAEKNFSGLIPKNFRVQSLDKSIDWFPVSYSNRIPFLSQWFTLQRLRRKAFKLNQKNKFHLVHARSYMPMLVTEKVKKKFQTKIIFDMRGFWADERIEGRIWDLKKIWFRKIYSFFKQKEKKWLRESEAIVVLTEAAKKHLVSSENISAEKITVIPCCADLKFFNPESLNFNDRNADEIHPIIYPKDFVLCYAGSLGTWYLLDEMMHFFSLLIAQQPEWKFLFITPEKRETIFQAAGKFTVNEKKIIVKKASRTEMQGLLSLADVGIFFIQNSFSKIASCPTKLAEFLAMGIPVISNSGIGDDDEIIRFPQNGILLSDFSEPTMKEAISGINELLNIPKNRIRESAIRYFDLNGGIERYKKIYEAL